MDGFSDRGSIPLSSIYYAESELIEFGFCAFGSAYGVKAAKSELDEFGFFALITMNDGESVFRLCRKEIFKQALASSALNNHQFR